MKQKLFIKKDTVHFTYWFSKSSDSKTNLKFSSLVLILFIGIHLGYSQDDDYYSSTDLYSPTQVINPSMKNPDIAAFEKVNFIPVSNYTGRANITIPIYEIVAGKMSVPITLSYNSSGVKVSDIPSSVGSNWSLNAGGVLSRSTRGMDDFSGGRTITLSNFNKYRTDRGWLSFYREGPLIGKNKYSLGKFDDYHPDLFMANAPGLSVKYYHTKSRVSDNQVVGGYPILFGDSKGIIVKETFGFSDATPWYSYNNPTPITPTNILGLTNATITNINGIKYTFSAPSFSFNSNMGSGRVKFESLQLSSMYDPSTDQPIQFHYQEYGTPQFDVHQSGLVYYKEGENVPSSQSKFTQHLSRRRLKRISWMGGAVKFDYNHQRTDGGDDYALSSITVYDREGNMIKKMKLQYSNFQSSIQSHRPQSRRLRLDKVYQVDAQGNTLPGYKLFYNTSMEMPPRDSYAHDYLGYNNGSYNPSLNKPIPKLYFLKRSTLFPPPLDDNGMITNVKSRVITPFFNSSGSVGLGGNYSLEADLEHAKTYSLTKMIYPTGGITEYEYELNEFYNQGATRKGGGLRIKSQKLIDEYGNEQIMDYIYYEGRINNFPSFAKITTNDCEGSGPQYGNCANVTFENGKVKGIGITTYRTPNSQVELTQGAFVGYTAVTVKNRINNGYTLYRYYTPKDYKNIPSTKKEFRGNGNLLYTLGAGELFADQDVYRGKLRFEIVYDKDHRPITEKRYEYKSKKFDDISLNFYNQSNPKCLRLDRSCDGFEEELKIPIERNLLSKVVTKEYSPSYKNTDPRENPIEEITEVFKTETLYHYDKDYPLLVREIRSLFEQCDENDQSCLPIESSKVEKKIQYAFASSLPFVNELKNQNRLNESMKIWVKENGKIRLQEESHFKKYHTQLINLEKINFFGNGTESSFSDVVTQRTVMGKIEEYQHKNGSFTTNLYAYTGNNLIAVISNARLEEVKNILSTNDISFSELYLTYNTTEIERATTVLREKLPKALVTSYLHKPLVGVTSITDPRGRKQSFYYDSFNRLKMIKDHNGNIVSNNEYHYKN
ncbi:hypothetical protein [Aquimarina sp. 2201CG14-23]|uniref:hypothetical protein n=1 Tax=Aquimarina mycalae TaxID=3040073 RepID=UPI00247817AF|nr:hypothetical protein [Aquimarina sp. 2201CG14-23]MDH7447670.1 hypothetical protein [Aquimarina sp. 2201CG14-23]